MKSRITSLSSESLENDDGEWVAVTTTTRAADTTAPAPDADGSEQPTAPPPVEVERGDDEDDESDAPSTSHPGSMMDSNTLTPVPILQMGEDAATDEQNGQEVRYLPNETPEWHGNLANIYHAFATHFLYLAVKFGSGGLIEARLFGQTKNTNRFQDTQRTQCI